MVEVAAFSHATCGVKKRRVRRCQSSHAEIAIPACGVWNPPVGYESTRFFWLSTFFCDKIVRECIFFRNYDFFRNEIIGEDRFETLN